MGLIEGKVAIVTGAGAGLGRAYDVPRRRIEREVNNKYIIYISM